MIKVIIANNDILYESLSNISLQYKGKIELINVDTNKLKNLIYQIKPRENLIILDVCTSVSFCNNILKCITHRTDKANVIILVINSKTLTNIIGKREEANYFLFRKEHTDFSALDVIDIIVNFVKNNIEIKKSIDDILWELGFASYFKGTIYLKDAILLAYNDNKLLQDMNSLVKKVAEKNGIKNDKLVRSAMDKSLNSILNFIDNSKLYSIFGSDYDGRKISVKYLIDLCIHHLDKQRYLCFDYLEQKNYSTTNEIKQFYNN